MINQTKKLAVLLLAGSIIILNSCMNKQNTPKAIDPVNMDLSVRPGDDFFKYANGGWMKNHPIPDEFSRYGAFEALGQLNEEQLKTLLAEAEAKTDAPKGSVAQQIADFYRSGMDTASINALGFQPIQKELDEIDALQSTDQLEAYVAMLHAKG
ncbi:MAG: M13 family peptidase, partial [Bacteroidales bacterium]|nr:M13 family peptidase [Bacteroidales bacterium]